MVEVRFSEDFKRRFRKLDAQQRERILKQVQKISLKPLLGKPMRYARKRTRELHVGSYRLVYLLDCEFVLLADFYHKDEQ